MGHLKRGASGHLLRNAAGHLVNRCAENTCNECDPPIPDTLYVTFAGLAGDFAWANGKTAVEYYYPCAWRHLEPDGSGIVVTYGYYGALNFWVAEVAGPGGDLNCNKEWKGSTYPNVCSPTDAYSEYACRDLVCDDSDSCEDSAGATCVVSVS